MLLMMLNAHQNHNAIIQMKMIKIKKRMMKRTTVKATDTTTDKGEECNEGKKRSDEMNGIDALLSEKNDQVQLQTTLQVI